MDIVLQTKLDPSPEQLAKMFWEKDSEEQSMFFSELYRIAGQHDLTVQTLDIRRMCENDPDAMRAFQIFFASAFKWCS